MHTYTHTPPPPFPAIPRRRGQRRAGRGGRRGGRRERALPPAAAPHLARSRAPPSPAAPASSVAPKSPAAGARGSQPSRGPTPTPGAGDTPGRLRTASVWREETCCFDPTEKLLGFSLLGSEPPGPEPDWADLPQTLSPRPSRLPFLPSRPPRHTARAARPQSRPGELSRDLGQRLRWKRDGNACLERDGLALESSAWGRGRENGNPAAAAPGAVRKREVLKRESLPSHGQPEKQPCCAASAPRERPPSPQPQDRMAAVTPHSPETTATGRERQESQPVEKSSQRDSHCTHLFTTSPGPEQAQIS